MHKIISLETTKISPSIFLSSRAIMTDTSDPFDSHYRFESILLSKDRRIKSHNYNWGSSNDYYLSFRLFQYTSWMHKRIANRIRYRLQMLRILEKIAKLKAKLKISKASSPSSGS